MKRIGLDLDGVLVSFNHSYGDLLIKVSGEDKLPEGWKQNPEFPPVWSWESFYGYSHQVEKQVWEHHILGSKNFWLRLKPMSHARETLAMLNSLEKTGSAEIYFISHRMGAGAKIQTMRWLYENGADFPTVLLSSDKVPLIKLLKLDFYIDDRIETMQELMGESWAKGKHYYLKDAPYNQAGRPPGLKVAPTVKDALIEAGIWN